MRAWPAAFAGIVALLCGLGACGGGGDKNRDAARADEAAVKRVLDDAFDALYDGDGARACSLYTSSYRREIVRRNQADQRRSAPGSTCEEQVANFAPALRRNMPDREASVIRISVSGDTATAVSEFATTGGKIRVREFLVREGGDWKIDGDRELGEAQPG